MYSICHFFSSLVRTKESLATAGKIRSEQFKVDLFSSYSNGGKYPDIAIRLNNDHTDFEGGELVWLKDSDSYTISPFSRTIPTGKQDLTKILSPCCKMWREMRFLGEDILAYPIRDVFYFIRGRHGDDVKICLVHGSFFETITANELIKGALQQILNETVSTRLDEGIRDVALEALSDQECFNRGHRIEGSSVSFRIEITTEVNSAGNILQYSEIPDNTLSLVLPSHTPEQNDTEQNRLCQLLTPVEFDQLLIRWIKHPLNGNFQVFQTPLFG